MTDSPCRRKVRMRSLRFSCTVTKRLYSFIEKVSFQILMSQFDADSPESGAVLAAHHLDILLDLLSKRVTKDFLTSQRLPHSIIRIQYDDSLTRTSNRCVQRFTIQHASVARMMQDDNGSGHFRALRLVHRR